MSFKPFYVSTIEAKANNERRTLFEPKSEQPFEPFLIQDPFGIRKAVVPVFRRDINGEIYGMGTAFHVDGWGTFLTADHVIDFAREHSKSTSFSPSSSGAHPVLLLGMGLIFGIVNIPKEAFALVYDIVSAMREKDDPLSFLQGKTEMETIADLAVMTAAFHPGTKAPHSIAVKVSGWYPSIGETVLAIGFPELECKRLDEQAQRALLSEGMYGAYGRITKIHTNGTNESHPTPVYEVECNWPSGMSGGPLFNSSGEVVGLVSRSLLPDDDLPGVGWATSFGLLPYFNELVPTLDILNSHWRRGWAVLKSDPWHLAGFFKTEELARQFKDSIGFDYEVIYGASCFGTDDFIREVM